MTKPTGSMQARLATKQEKRRFVLDVLYQLLGSGPVEGMSTARLRELMGSDADGVDLQHMVYDIKELGVYKADIVYGTAENGLPPGRHSTWTILVGRDEAERRLAALDRREVEDLPRKLREGSAKQSASRRAAHADKTSVVRYEDDEPVEAIAGPEPPSPFAALAAERKDEAWALVEAARQYVDRGSRLERQIDALLSQARDLGLTVDEAALRSSIQPDKADERLEAVSLALPYIDRLERRIARLEEDNAKIKAQITDRDKLNREVTTLRRQNQQLLARQLAN